MDRCKETDRILSARQDVLIAEARAELERRSFARLLRDLHDERAGLTWTWMARLLGVHRNTVEAWAKR